MEDEPIDVTEMPFGGYRSSSMEEKLKYMSVHHLHFLPDAEYITDLRGFCSDTWSEGWSRSHVSLVQQDIQNNRGLSEACSTGACKIQHRRSTLCWSTMSGMTTPPATPDAENPEEEMDLNSLDDTGSSWCCPAVPEVGHRSLVRSTTSSL